MRLVLALVLLLALLAAGCGSTTASRPQDTPPASGSHGPPAAWIETKAGSRWLGFSSFCWPGKHTGVCGDAVAPECGRPAVPDITMQSGETVRAHLGYTPTEASVEGADAQLDGRTVSWRVEQPGPFLLFSRATGRDASYVGCAVIR